MAEPKGNKAGAAEGLPPELSLAGIRKRPVSPLNERVWRFLLFISGGCLVGGPMLDRLAKILDCEVEHLEAGGLLLGFLPDQTYTQKEVSLRPGDILVLYTDGITEASAPRPDKGERELFGEQRLVDIVRANQSGAALEIQSAILRAISGYTADTPQEDDITLVIIRRVQP